MRLKNKNWFGEKRIKRISTKLMNYLMNNENFREFLACLTENLNYKDILFYLKL